MSIALRQIWSDDAARPRMIAALRAWNRALCSGQEAEKVRAAELMKEIFAAAEKKPTTKINAPADLVERLLDFPSQRLAVYGSLAPGKQNHHMMAGMDGTWRRAVLRGTLHNAGWGAGQGFPGFVWDGSDTAIAAQVFTSRDLPGHWQRLDEFEGREYRRTLVPVTIEGGEVEVCNVYELAEELG